MCAAMFKWIRLYMDFTPQEMREILGLSRRTHQSYESGYRKVSLEAANASWGIFERDREFLAGIGDRVDQNLKKGDLNETCKV